MLRSAFLSLPFFSFFLFFSCQNSPGSAVEIGGKPSVRPDTIHLENVPTEGAATYTITEGMVNWSGQPAIGSGHSGTIRVSGGQLMVNRGQLLSGVVTIDMNSITVTDLQDGGERRDLEGHLKHADFFEVEKYPTGEFKFDEILPSNLPDFNWVVSGELTLKGKSNPINIPIKMTISGDELVAESPAFQINRTQWGVNFRSGLLATPKDKLIQDMILLSLKVKGKKSN